MYTLHLKDNSQVIWELSLSHDELVAGLLAAGSHLLRQSPYTLVSSLNLEDYILARRVSSDYIARDSCGTIPANYLALWVKSDEDNYYNLYKFKRSSFIQGIISLCFSWHMDFRDIIYGLPFDSTGTTYTLDNYILNPNSQAIVTIDQPDYEDEPEEWTEGPREYPINVNEP